MHYYKRNLGDYAKKAGRLSMLQHGSYTLLIDACYDREQFPTLDEAIEWTWASTTEEIEAVTFVLRKFFVVQDGLYVQQRIADELADYQGKAVTNKRIADEREANRRNALTVRDEKSTKRVPVVNEPPPNHEPRTNNQEPIKEKKASPTPASPAFVCPEWIPAETWAAYLQVRKDKKNKNGTHALDLIVKDLVAYRAKGYDAVDVLNNSIKNGWVAVYEPKGLVTFASAKADIARSTISSNRDVEATEARVRADAAIPRNGPSLAVLAQMAAIRGHRLAS
jgi:uncharacterized protein YdaU (DUF1376 family)